MRPRTRAEMDEVVRTLVRDCIELQKQANLRQTDLATLLGTSRLTVSRWHQHLDDGGEWEDLPVGGSTSAIIFMNLMIVRRLLETSLEDGSLPIPEANQGRLARKWVQSCKPDLTR